MEVTDQMIRKLADLSGLGFRDEELPRIREDLVKMIGFIEKLKELDLRDVKPLLQVSGNHDVFREDITGEHLSREDALLNATVHDGKFFKAPLVFKKIKE